MHITVLRNRKVMQQLQPNTTLQGGKYKIERVLGQGGFGITYLATQMSLQRQVAIKEFFMKDFCGRDERTKMVSAPTTGSNRLVDQYRKKFTKEARNLAKLNHPNIINVIDVFEENGTVYYAMPYLSGGSLDDYVRRHGALDESEAMKYVKQIARALKYMHEEHHICHYDVKPANILLDDKGNAVLIDFGISKNYDASGHETSTTPIGLSEGYAPIEQYQQSVEEFSPVSDVYALGATLYFLLHGKRPVNAPSRAGGTSLLMKKDLSQDTKNLISSTMKISKTERSQTMDVFFKEREVVESSYHHEGIDVGKIVFLVIIASIIIGGAVYYYTGGLGGNIPQKNSIVDLVDTVIVDNNAQEPPQETSTDIYKDRVEQFAKKQSGVIASYPNDKRYSVYYTQKDRYGCDEMFRYDALSDKTEHIDLPLEATCHIKNIWLTKNNRFIFVTTEERYSDFIRIDTETGQVKDIDDCVLVKRTRKGFILVQKRCINEYSATCVADEEYAYTDYYYDEEGICVGHGEEYTDSPYE